jgi:hypothetical protein
MVGMDQMDQMDQIGSIQGQQGRQRGVRSASRRVSRNHLLVLIAYHRNHLVALGCSQPSEMARDFPASAEDEELHSARESGYQLGEGESGRLSVSQRGRDAERRRETQGQVASCRCTMT